VPGEAPLVVQTPIAILPRVTAWALARGFGLVRHTAVPMIIRIVIHQAMAGATTVCHNVRLIAMAFGFRRVVQVPVLLNGVLVPVLPLNVALQLHAKP